MKNTTYTEYVNTADDGDYEDDEDEYFEAAPAPVAQVPVRRRVVAAAAPVQYADADGYEYEEVEQPVGLFSTPARTVTFIGAVVMLMLVAGSIAWMLGSQPSQVSPVSGNQPAAASVAPRVGALAPDFNLVDVKTNQPLKLSGLRGKPVFVNFWGTWCPPCRAEMPEMEKLFAQYKDQVAFVGVSMGPRDEPMGVNQFVKLNKYSWTFVHDSDSSVMTRYQVNGIPSSYFVDKDGIIRSIHVGGADYATLEQGLKKAQ